MGRFYFPTKSTLVHLRFLYSLYLLPVFLFGLSRTPNLNLIHILFPFILLHFLIYPASNGYNSFFDKDEGSIGGVKSPPKVDRSLLTTSWILDILGSIGGFFIRWEFGLGLILYGVFSKLYSHPITRFKSKPISSFFIVFFFQGAFVYFLTRLAVSSVSLVSLMSPKEISSALFTSFMVGASYVITQVYQHFEDQLRGDITLSVLLGIRGTFIFSGICFICSMILLITIFSKKVNYIIYFFGFTVPVVLYFLFWFSKVWSKPSEANFKNTMRMSTLSFLCLSAYFVFLIYLQRV